MIEERMTPDPAYAGREQDGRFSPGCSGIAEAGHGEVTPGEAEKTGPTGERAPQGGAI